MQGSTYRRDIQFDSYRAYFTATPPDRRWQRNEGLLLLHNFLSLDILVAFFDTLVWCVCEKRLVSRFDAV